VEVSDGRSRRVSVRSAPEIHINDDIEARQRTRVSRMTVQPHVEQKRQDCDWGWMVLS